MTPPTRVLICEDSATYALGLKRFLQVGDHLEVVGVCADGEATLEALGRLKPDVITMDLELPGMGGVRAVQEIMRTHPVPILVLSGHVGRRTTNGAEALAAGALDALPKAHVHIDDPDGASAVALRHRLVRLARSRVGAPAERRAGRPPVELVDGGGPLARAIGIGASVGGPQTLLTMLSTLPADFAVPVLVVQHMAPGFTEGLVEWLQSQIALPVTMAREGQPARPGVVFAPEGAHLRLDRAERVDLDRDNDAGPHRPSVDALLGSLAWSVGPAAVGVVLTGMGRDGERGVAAIRRCGGRVIAQDETTSTVFGMPQAAASAGADVILPLPRIAAALVALAAGRPVA